MNYDDSWRTRGGYTIIYKNGYYGLSYAEKTIIPCLFPEMRFAHHYLCLYNGEKWGVILISKLRYLKDGVIH